MVNQNKAVLIGVIFAIFVGFIFIFFTSFESSKPEEKLEIDPSFTLQAESVMLNDEEQGVAELEEIYSGIPSRLRFKKSYGNGRYISGFSNINGGGDGEFTVIETIAGESRVLFSGTGIAIPDLTSQGVSTDIATRIVTDAP